MPEGTLDTEFAFKRSLRVLQLEDNLADAELVQALLETAGFSLEMRCVQTQIAFRNALDQGGFDLIISDFSLPSFDGLSALALARQQQPRVPFIFFSGTIGEEVAVESLKTGATDYVLKQRPQRLVAAVRRALREMENRERRREAEEKLRRSEQQFRQIAENVADLIAVLDLNGRRIYNSPSYAPLLGDPAALVGTDSFGDVHPEDRERIRRVFQETVGTGIGQRAEFRFLLRDGTVRYIESQGSVIRDEQGTIVNVLVVSRDVTERRLAEAQISEQAALLDKAQDAICVTDMNQRILYWNKSAADLYGWSVAEALGQNANELLFKPDDTARPIEALKSLIARREWKGELKQVTKAGNEIVVESRWTLVQDAHGRPRSILIINTDVTEKKELETQFFRSQRLENIGMLASGIAHDLNNVLSPIMMAIPMLEENLSDPTSGKILETLDRSVRRGADLVRQILSFARGVESEHRQIQLKHLITDVEKIISQTFPKSIRFEKNVANDLWTIHGNATQMHQILLNLCVNARDAMPRGGTLSITARNHPLDAPVAGTDPEIRPGPGVCVVVKDTGTGIPRDLLEQIFEPFFTTKEPGKGTGLGLATVRGIAKNHGGFVEVESEVGRGTSFKVFLPASQAGPVMPPDEPTSQMPSGRDELVLVVDDEAALRQIAKAMLENYGYRVLTAANGVEAVTVFKDHANEIKAVILDSMMPFMDGPATLRALRATAPELKILGVSGLGGGEGFSEEQGGVDAFLSKPYTATQLLSALRRALTPKS